MSNFDAAAARQTAMAVNRKSAENLPPDAAKMKKVILDAVLKQAEKAADGGDMSATSLVANVPPPGKPESLRYTGRLTIRDDVMKKQEASLGKAFAAVEADLIGRGFKINSSSASVSGFDASCFVTFQLSW